MKKLWQKLKSIGFVYITGGFIISIFSALLLVGLTAVFVQEIYKDNRSARLTILIPTCVAAFVLFVFMMRRFVNKKFRMLKHYYIMASVISFTAAIIAIEIMDNVINAVVGEMSAENPTTKELLLVAAILFVILAVGIFVFLAVFGLITKKKAMYISYICDEVGKLASDSENVVIEEKGGDELEKISASINKMSKELNEKRQHERELERQRSELITNVSHDLRSPLTSIIGYVRLLKENGCKDEEKFNEYIEVTDRRLEGLNKLVGELFELTKLDVPDLTLNFESCDVTGFIRQFGFEMTQILAQKGLTLECDIDAAPFPMQIDIERMVRVMQNLFANVIKYAERSSQVGLTCHAASDNIEISVSNRVPDGTDINTENMFDRFYKDDTSRTDTSGAGLGLAIAKRIVELHGGKIFAKQESGIITITVSLSRSAEKPIPAQ